MADLEICHQEIRRLYAENAELRANAGLPKREDTIRFYGIEAKILKWVYSDDFRGYLAKQIRGIRAGDIDPNIKLQMIDIHYSEFVGRPECALQLWVGAQKRTKRGNRLFDYHVRLVFDYDKFEPVECEVYR